MGIKSDQKAELRNHSLFANHLNSIININDGEDLKVI